MTKNKIDDTDPFHYPIQTDADPNRIEPWLLVILLIICSYVIVQVARSLF
jgi:hypothetical protein